MPIVSVMRDDLYKSLDRDFSMVELVICFV